MNLLNVNVFNGLYGFCFLKNLLLPELYPPEAPGT